MHDIHTLVAAGLGFGFFKVLGLVWGRGGGGGRDGGSGIGFGFSFRVLQLFVGCFSGLGAGSQGFRGALAQRCLLF